MSEAPQKPRRGRGRPSAAAIEDEFTDNGSLAEGPEGADGLTVRQRRVLQVIQDYVTKHGYPPSIRQVGVLSGLSSPSSVQYQMRALEAKGFIRRDPHLPRAMEVRMPAQPEFASRTTTELAEVEPDATYPQEPTSVAVPVLGRIAAGGPILAEQHIEDIFALPKQIIGSGEHFMLEVKGDSMVDAAICDGDWVLVRQQPNAENGDIVAALLDDEATVKTFKKLSNQVWLLPHNPAYDPIDGNNAVIMGKVVAVLRKI